MYYFLLVLHAVFRWLVVSSIAFAVYRALRGYFATKPFTKMDNTVRHWTATIAHIQLMVGIVLYTRSPLVKHAFTAPPPGHAGLSQAFFFGVVHAVLMLGSIVVVTIGSALARRRVTDRSKFRTMLWWYSAALFLLLVAIPWPFSPLAQRPLFRSF